MSEQIMPVCLRAMPTLRRDSLLSCMLGPESGRAPRTIVLKCYEVKEWTPARNSYFMPERAPV